METIKINMNTSLDNDFYYKVDTALLLEADDVHLGEEDNFSENFLEELRESLVPEFIDMERIKFVPGIYDGKNITLANEIDFYLHFIKRKEIPNDENGDKDRMLNSVYTSGNVYYDSWHIDEDTRETTWWNEYNYSNNFFDVKNFTDFNSKNGKTSDLIGYLNFTDKDVFYRKKKISQSFIRLLFYNSPKPIEQKLLFYSTIFLDGGELYGKYIKQLTEIQKEIKKNASIGVDRKNENAFVVMYSGGTRVDSKISVTHEYDRTKSAEGFNLYLFKENYSDIIGQTIYMKVEFNHAGNGKTTPLIMWPKFYWDPYKNNEDGTKGGYQHTNEYQPLTTGNFIESLYTKVNLYFDEDSKSFIYYFPEAEHTDGNIELILYEPKLDMSRYDGEGGGENGGNNDNPNDNPQEKLYEVYVFDIDDDGNFITIYSNNKVSEGTLLSTILEDDVVERHIESLEKDGYKNIKFIVGNKEVDPNTVIKSNLNVFIEKHMELKNEYQLIFVNITSGNETILSKKLKEGDKINYPEVENYIDENNVEYVFVWNDKSYDGQLMPPKDLIITGKYIAVTLEAYYLVNIYEDDVLILSESVLKDTVLSSVKIKNDSKTLEEYINNIEKEGYNCSLKDKNSGEYISIGTKITKDYELYLEKTKVTQNLTFTNRASLLNKQALIAPTIAVYNNNEKVLELAPGQTGSIPIEDDVTYNIWLTPVDGNGKKITSEYYYYCEGVNKKYKRPIICNGIQMNSIEHGLTIDEITFNRECFEYVIKEYTVNDFKGIEFVTDENMDDSKYQIVLSITNGGENIVFQNREMEYPISSSMFGGSGASISITIELKNMDGSNLGNAYVYWTDISTGLLVKRQTNSLSLLDLSIQNVDNLIHGPYKTNDLGQLDELYNPMVLLSDNLTNSSTPNTQV